MRIAVAKNDPALKMDKTKSPDKPAHCNTEGERMVGPPGVEPGTNGL